MNTSVYTLLIVESPILARVMQNFCPPSVYIVATDGFCWQPKYDASKNQLKAIVDPDKADIRKEIKEQAKWANSVIIATDNDPSGDFIAWSVSRFLKSTGVKRGTIHNLSKSGIYSMLSDVQELDDSRLEIRLKNRFLIRDLWNKNRSLPDPQLAGLAAVFGAEKRYSHFLNEDGLLFKSSEQIQCAPDELISVYPEKHEQHFTITKPLSTFDVLEAAKEQELSQHYHEAQLLLQQLFQTTLQFSDDALISYPRTDARAFYSETWESLKNQYIRLGSVNQLKPTFLQEIADADAPHESIYPLRLSVKPQDVAGELSSKPGQLYEWIYHHTIKSITIPEALAHSYVNELNPGIYFYPHQNRDFSKKSASLNPCTTVSDLGIKLNKSGVLKPSKFGKAVDEWLKKGWVQIRNNVVTPGKPVRSMMGRAQSFQHIFASLNRQAENNSLAPETVQSILSS